MKRVPQIYIQKFCFHDEKTCEIDRIHENITAEKFYVDYILKRKPCILKSEYVIKNKLNIDLNFMKEKIENVNVHLEKRISNSFGTGEKKKMKFHKFLSLLEKGNKKYYLNTQYVKENAYHPKDFCNSITRQMINYLPKELEIMGNLEIYQYNIWLGNNKSTKLKTYLHHDYHDNIYVLLKGKKTFRIYSPNFAYRLKTNGKIFKVHKNGLITYWPFIRSDGSHILDVYKKQMNNIYNEINIMNEVLNKKDPLVDNQTIKDSINKAEEKLNLLEENILNYKLKKHDFHRQPNARQDIPNHFCLIHTRKRKEDDNIFDKNTNIRKKYIEVNLNEGDILYLPCGWFHEVKSFSSEEQYHLAFNYWYYPPYIKTNKSANVENKFDNPYVDKYLSERNIKLYKKIGIYKQKNSNLTEILSYYKNMKIKKIKKNKKRKNGLDLKKKKKLRINNT
ncbi:hypothetical protein PFUGPA_05161 [Plasmodium falciparum Palo Alto/Uganda]|uniref:JmjC domain-containing protein n=2 Tax=Plasmodium falciparum TaxID=5833 RepID=W4ISA0_PLAFP|nr:hypothetical protein PFUGPA_05161 [Plasmodium falciparum Palo Alto/Uganda]